MLNFIKTNGPKVGTILSALFIVLSNPQPEFYYLVWIALIPWFFSLNKCSSLKEAAVQGLWLDILCGFGGAYWIVDTVPRFLEVPVFMGIVALLIYSLVFQFHLILFALVFYWLLNRSHLSILLIIVLTLTYTGLDWLVPNIFQFTLGNTLHNSPTISQLADIGGSFILTFLVLMVNLSLFSLLQFSVQNTKAKAKNKFPTSILAFLVIVILISYSYGYYRYYQIADLIKNPIRQIQVGIVQENAPLDLKKKWMHGDNKAADFMLRLNLKLSDQLLNSTPKPDIIVWPETSYPGIFRKPENEKQLSRNIAFDKYVAQHKTTFIFGAYDKEDRTDKRVLRNSLFAVQPKPEQEQKELSHMDVYHKYILLPVGEYLPFVSHEFAQKWLPGIGAFSRGQGPKTLKVNLYDKDPINIGPLICYEDLFSSHTIALLHKGARLIVNVSNDGWFGKYGLPKFHLIAAKLRSIETRLPQIRATNTGYSALILPNGEIKQITAIGKKQTLNVQVPIIEPPNTLMSLWGNWFGLACFILSLTSLPWLKKILKEN